MVTSPPGEPGESAHSDADVGGYDATRMPGALRLTALLVLLQGVGLLGVALFYLVEIVAGKAHDFGLSLFAVGLQVAAGAGLVQVARGLRGGRRWGRAPALLTQLLVIPVAIDLSRGGRWYIGVPLLVWAAVLVVLLLSSAVSAALDD